jgi:hypothetical protein
MWSAAVGETIATFPSTPAQRFVFRWMVLFFRLELLGFVTGIMPDAVATKVSALLRPAFPQTAPAWFTSFWPACPGCQYNGMFWQAQFPWAALTALIGALVWRLLDRDRFDYRRLFIGWHTIVRYTCAVNMLQWGFFKLNGTQFWTVHSDAFLIGRPLGEWSTRALMWNTMGQSVVYGMFTGVGEIVGGLMLFFRRTTLLGALLLLFVNGTIFILDILMNRGGVTAVALWKALLATGLVLVEWPRLKAFYLKNAPVIPSARPRLLPGVAGVIVKCAILALLVKSGAWGRIAPLLSAEERAKSGWKYVPHAMSGLFHVEEMSRNGQPLVPRHDDTTSWAFVGMGTSEASRSSMRGTPSSLAPSAFYIIRPDGALHEGYAFTLDTARGTITVDTSARPRTLQGMQFGTWQGKVTGPFTYKRQDIDRFTLRAVISGDTIVATLRRLRPNQTTLFGSPRLVPHNYGSPIRWPRQDSVTS